MAIARVVDITASDNVKVIGEGTVIVESNEEFDLTENEVGFLEGKKHHHHKGIFMQGGILNPGWKGRLTIELSFKNEVKITEGDKLAHAIILTLDDKVETTRDTKDEATLIE